VTIVGRTWDVPVEHDLRSPARGQPRDHRRHVAYLRQRVDEVIFDAEHFFDGWRSNPAYALQCLATAAEAGATLLCLCDTAGGSVPPGRRRGDARRAAPTSRHGSASTATTTPSSPSPTRSRPSRRGRRKCRAS
jgi:hypothetical protein